MFISKNKKDLYIVYPFYESDLHSVIRANILDPNHIQLIFFKLVKVFILFRLYIICILIILFTEI
jgi:hypothetical protein